MKRSPMKPRRKGLERRAELPRSTEPMRKTTLRSKGKPTAKASVAAIRERSGDVCERCHARPGSEPHHVRGRRQGRDDGPENLRWLCHDCHDWATTHPREAHVEGVSYSAKWAAREDTE